MHRSSFLQKITFGAASMTGFLPNRQLSTNDENGLRAIRNMDYVILLCNDLSSMKTFYTSVMQFPIYRDLDNWIELTIGSSLLTLRERGRKYDGNGNTGSASIQLAFRVTPDQVDRCYEELKSAGVPILEPPKEQEWGHKTLFFRDPEHNILEIYADI